MRRTVRFKLTLLYGGLFLLSGAALLGITYGLVVHATAGVVFTDEATGGTVSMMGETPAERQAILLQNEVLRQLLVQSGVALGVMAVASMGLGWLVAGRVLRPLRTITAAARQISATNLHERLALDGPDDELTELGGTFDALLDRLEAAFQAQRQFVANASHELRSPLTRQRVLAQVALADPDASVESLRAAHERVLASGGQQERLIESLLTLSRGQAGTGERQPFDLASVTSEVVGARRAEARHRDLTVQCDLEPAPMAGDPRLVERLVANLVDNALFHNVGGGSVGVATATRAGTAVLTVTNTGPVVPPDEVDRLREPFQRLAGRNHGNGTGLGLSIVHAIAETHGAHVTTEPGATGGLTVEVGFP